MNWVLGLVLIVLLVSGIHGYRRGLLRMLLRLVEGIVILAFVSWATPYVADFLVEHTPIETTIQTHCSQYLQDSVNAKIDSAETDGQEKADATQAQLESMGVVIPESVINRLDGTIQNTGDLAGQAIENTGIYDELSKQLSDVAVRGISFLITLFFAFIAFQILSRIIRIIEKIPLIGGMNRMLGIVAGLILGILIIWLAFSVVALTSTMGASVGILSYIKSSSFLMWIYENNLVLALLMLYL